jgi:hypothetical protein
LLSLVGCGSDAQAQADACQARIDSAQQRLTAIQQEESRIRSSIPANVAGVGLREGDPRALEAALAGARDRLREKIPLLQGRLEAVKGGMRLVSEAEQIPPLLRKELPFVLDGPRVDLEALPVLQRRVRVARISGQDEEAMSWLQMARDKVGNVHAMAKTIEERLAGGRQSVESKKASTSVVVPFPSDLSSIQMRFLPPLQGIDALQAELDPRVKELVTKATAANWTEAKP